MATNLYAEDTFELLGFAGKCEGFVLDFSVGASINIGFWPSFSDIPGSSTAVGLGVDIPLTSFGVGISWVFSGLNGESDPEGTLNGFNWEEIASFFDRPPPMAISIIGLILSIGLPGVGISAVDLSFHDCYANARYFSMFPSFTFSKFKV